MKSSHPLVIAHHLVWTAYGWWLPNDPRGSMSREIRNPAIAPLGGLHHGRKRIQPAGGAIRRFYDNAAPVLQSPLLKLGPREAPIVAEAFAEVIRQERYTCYACAIMPDHVHLLVRKHKHPAEEIIAHFQTLSRSRLRDRGLRTEDHPVWGGPGWKVFLDHPDGVRRTVRYIEENPRDMGRPDQRWGFVTTYDGWPLHAGHSPNSPYAKALRRAGRYP